MIKSLIRGAEPSASHGGSYSRRVDRLRFVLPAIALLLLAVVMAWPWLAGGYGGLIVPVFKNAADHVGDAMRMTNPRYVGRTDQAKPYEVTASSAFLDPTDPDRIHLDRLHATFEQGGEDGKAGLERDPSSTVNLSANEGIYMRDENRLELEGALELVFGDGYRFNTESAEVDLERGLVVGPEPVTGEGPAGTLAADRFDIEDGGKRLRFEGRVQMTIHEPVEPET
jgi:lipopolysaccharide export system protein LptC